MTDTPEWYVTETNYNTLEVFDTIKNEIICGIYGGKTIGEQYEIASRIANLPNLEFELDTAIAERDAFVKALEECREDSIELLGERDWWKDEPRSDYKKRYEETLNNIARADAALAAVKTTNQANG
jgi:hypothetical protein